MKKITIKIDGKKITCTEGKMILRVAQENGVEIPHLCDHPDLQVKANCRMCVVKIKGRNGLFTACSTPAEDEMEIVTEDKEIRRSRKTNLELIFGQHHLDCENCTWGKRCGLLQYQKPLRAKITRFPNRKEKRQSKQFGPIIFEGKKCIDCRNCVEVCPVGYYEIEKRGSDISIEPSKDKNKDCVYCGQCIVHCPVGAIKSDGEFEEMEKVFELKKQGKVLVVQFAPSIRTSIGEEFGMPYGSIATDKLSAALKKLGFDYVFDTSVGADFTTTEEAGEAIERILSGKDLPIFTSCCPSWVKYVEFYHPHLRKNISHARSPQMMLASIVKNYFAPKQKIDPKNIVMVSIMPCTAKKYEASRPELNFENGLKPIDYVWTTRELAWILKDKKIDLKTIKDDPADNPLGDPSGAGVLYGASGGVMESALRTAYFRLFGRDLQKVDFEQVRGQDGIKRATIRLCKPVKFGGDKCVELRVAVVNGLKNAKIILDELKEDPKKYQFVEVMACPGGCIGGGGQPLPTNEEIRQKRAASLYQIDKIKKVRLAHQNPQVQQVYKEFLTDKKLTKKMFEVDFKPEGKSKIKIKK